MIHDPFTILEGEVVDDHLIDTNSLGVWIEDGLIPMGSEVIINLGTLAPCIELESMVDGVDFLVGQLAKVDDDVFLILDGSGHGL